MLLSLATEAADDVAGEHEASEEEEGPSWDRGGPGVGLAHIGGEPSGAHDFGLALELRAELKLGESLGLSLMSSAGFTHPERTVAAWEWGIQHAEWTTNGFRDVTDWVGDDGFPPTPLREFSALFAYMGLGFSYLLVPLAFLASPFASAGHVIAAPSLRFHDEVNGIFLEGGGGALLFGHPETDALGAAVGPVIGAGLELGRQMSVGGRLFVAPPGFHSAADPSGDTVLATMVVLDL